MGTHWAKLGFHLLHFVMVLLSGHSARRTSAFSVLCAGALLLVRRFSDLQAVSCTLTTN